MIFELAILDFIYNMHNPVLDKIMTFITHLGDGGILWIVAGILMCITKKYRRAGATTLLALLLMLVIGNITLKPIIARIRPYEYAPHVRLIIDTPHDFSFPSGHTFASFASAVSVFMFHKKEGIAALCVASLIAFSRLYLYVHFPTDILAGIILGIAVAFTSRAIINKMLSSFA